MIRCGILRTYDSEHVIAAFAETTAPGLRLPVRSSSGFFGLDSDVRSESLFGSTPSSLLLLRGDPDRVALRSWASGFGKRPFQLGHCISSPSSRLAYGVMGRTAADWRFSFCDHPH